jgi:tetratricopeptide (TPR) repeat protein
MDNAATYFEQALQIAEDRQYCNIEICACQGLGNACLARQDVESAIRYHAHSVRVANVSGNVRLEALGQWYLAIDSHLKHDHSDVIEHCVKARNLDAQLTDAWYYEGLACVHLANGSKHPIERRVLFMRAMSCFAQVEAHSPLSADAQNMSLQISRGLNIPNLSSMRSD